MSDNTTGSNPPEENDPYANGGTPDPWAAPAPGASDAPTPEPPASPQQPPVAPPVQPAQPWTAPPAGATPPGQPAPGAYPPPGGAYPPPGQPPYGAPGQPPYGAQQPYGGAPAQAVQIGEAFSYGWNKFTQNVGVIILGALTYVAILAVLLIIFFTIIVGTAAVSTDPNTNELTTTGGLGFGFSSIVFAIIFVVLGFLVQAAIIQVSLLITRGKKIEYADFFKFPNIGNVVLASVIVGIAAGILSFTIIGGIVFLFFANFTLFFVIDKNQGAIDALKSSFSLVSKNLVTVIILFLAVYVAQAIGSFLCGVGLLIALPVCQIASTYVYRRLINEQPV